MGYEKYLLRVAHVVNSRLCTYSHFDPCSECLEKETSTGDQYVSRSHFDPCSGCLEKECNLVITM